MESATGFLLNDQRSFLSQSMKTKIAFLLAVFIPFAARSADAPSAALQQGLFEEEASQNLAAAIAAYQSVLTAHAEERKLAATALFRLGECHRKLGQTNDAIAQYQRLIRDFADQPSLANLSRQNLTRLGARAALSENADGTTGAGDQMLLRQRAPAAQLAEAGRLESLVKQLQDLPRSELRRVLPTVEPDTLLNTLLEQFSQSERKLAAQRTSATDDNPLVKETLNGLKVLNQQIDERMEGIVQGLKVKSSVLARESDVLRRELAGPVAETKIPRTKGMMGLTVPELMQLYAAQNPPGSTVEAAPLNTSTQDFPPAVRAQLKELLQGEITIAEQLLAEQRKKAKAGVVSPGEVDRFARDVLGLRRQLLAVDGLVAAEDRKQWRELLLEEIALAERAVQVERSKLDNGLSAPSELAKLQRDVLAIKRELVTFDAAPALNTSVRPVASSPATSAALEELQRTEQMLARINGWDISQLRKLLPTVVPDADLETLNAALMKAEQSMLSTDDDAARKLLAERVEQLRRRTEVRIAEIRNLLHERVESLRKSVVERR